MLFTLGKRLQAWVESSAEVPWGLAFIRQLIRIVWWSVQVAAKGELTLHAMSLAYTTLLSLVPLLAVSFSLLKAFGAHNQIEPLLLQLLAPLGEQSIEITQQLVGFVDNIKVGVLGAVGVAVLFYTVVTLMQKIERSFNHIWQVHRIRPLSQRVAYYLSIILIGPVLVLAATALSTTILHTDMVVQMQAIGPVGALLSWGTRLASSLMIVLAFVLIYGWMPNTRVYLSSALFGAVVAGLLWETVGMLFAHLVVTSTNYTAVYSTFASLVLFMVWVSVAWMIVLFGALLSYAYQQRQVLRLAVQQQLPTMVEQEQLALAVMQQVCQGFMRGDSPLSTIALARVLSVPVAWLSPLVAQLAQVGLLQLTEQQAWLPGRSPEYISADDVLAVVRQSGATSLQSRISLPAELATAWHAADTQRTAILADYHFNNTLNDR